MSGGVAYVLDEDCDLYMKVNKSMITLEEVTNKYDAGTQRYDPGACGYTNSEKVT